MPLRQYRPDNDSYDNSIPREQQQAPYQPYQATNPNRERVKELFFFFNIAIFSVMTVIAAYIYLSYHIPVFLTFILAILTGLVGLKLIQSLIQKKLDSPQHKIENKK